MGVSRNFGRSFLGTNISGSAAIARCPSVNEFHKQPCAREHSHPGLCYPADRNHGSWEDKYRVGYRPVETSALVDAVNAALDDIRQAGDVIGSDYDLTLSTLGRKTLAGLVDRLRAHEEALKAAIVGEALK